MYYFGWLTNTFAIFSIQIPFWLPPRVDVIPRRLGPKDGCGCRCSPIVNSPRPIQNLAFSWGGLPGKVAPTCVYLLWISCVR